MRIDPEGRFEAAIGAYAHGDFELAASYFAEDCHYAIYVPTEPGPFGGVINGRAAIRERFERVAEEFDAIKYEAHILAARENRVRAQIFYVFRHRETGEKIDGVGRIEAVFEAGKIIDWRAYHDADRIQAFVRLCRSKRSAGAFDEINRICESKGRSASGEAGAIDATR